MNFSVSYPLKRHAFQRVGATYSLSKSYDYGLQHRLADLLPDHQLPVRHSGLECAGRHHQQPDLAHLLLQHRQQPGAAAHRQGIHGGLPGGRHLGQCALHFAAGGLQALHPHALPAFRPRTATTCLACARSWATYRASAATWLRPTTASTPAARASCAASTCAAQRLTAMCPAGSTSSSPIPTAVAFRATPPIPKDNQCIQVPLAGLRRGLHRRRHQPDHQRRVPHSDRRDAHVLVLRRLRHRCGHQPRTVEAEPGGICLADRAALWLPGLQQRLLPGRHPWLAGRVPAGHPAHLGHQLCSPHVAGRRTLDHHADRQRALPPLLRVQPAAPLRDALSATT